MALANIGTAESQRNFFNYAYLTIANKYMVDVESISLNMSFEAKHINSLNTIKRVASRRSNYTAELSMTIKSDSVELKKLFFSASSVSSNETTYNVRDGQQINTNDWILTVYEDDAKTKGRQFTLIDPLIVSWNETNSSNEFWQAEITVSVNDIVELDVR